MPQLEFWTSLDLLAEVLPAERCERPGTRQRSISSASCTRDLHRAKAVTSAAGRLSLASRSLTEVVAPNYYP